MTTQRSALQMQESKSLAQRVVALIVCALCVALPLHAYAQNGDVAVTIAIVEGADQIVDSSHTVDILVRVTPPGATVTFKVPAELGVTFPGGANRVTITSDLLGFARSGRLSGTGKAGKFDVEVEATYMGQKTVAVVHESVGEAADSTKPAAKKSRKVMWIAIIGAAAAGGALAAMKMGDSGGSGSTTTPPVVTIGNPTVGAPQ